MLPEGKTKSVLTSSKDIILLSYSEVSGRRSLYSAAFKNVCKYFDKS